MDQLKNADFLRGFDEYLRMKLDIAVRDREYFTRTGNAALRPLPDFWAAWYGKLLEDFNGRYGRDIIDAFRSLQDRGHIEVLTSAATHGYFPLLARDESVRHQVRQGRHTYRKYFGREARGFWIPSAPIAQATPGRTARRVRGLPRLGVDEVLGQEGIGYFFVDSHLLKGEKPRASTSTASRA